MYPNKMISERLDFLRSGKPDISEFSAAETKDIIPDRTEYNSITSRIIPSPLQRVHNLIHALVSQPVLILMTIYENLTDSARLNQYLFVRHATHSRRYFRKPRTYSIISNASL
jgi:hypothetical protein